MLVRVLWAGRYGRGAVDRSDALATEVLVVLCWLECCCVWRRWRRRTQVAQMAQEDYRRTQVAQMAQEDAGDAGDASDAPAARGTKRTGKGDR